MPTHDVGVVITTMIYRTFDSKDEALDFLKDAEDNPNQFVDGVVIRMAADCGVYNKASSDLFERSKTTRMHKFKYEPGSDVL